jgi:4-hydroxy-tetrahydrodipicolinate reductase
MGTGIARLVLDKPGLELVGAIAHRPAFVGRDVGEVLGLGRTLGIRVTDRPEELLDREKVDVVSIATTSWAAEQAEDLRRILGAGIHAVSIAEELAEPAAQHPELAAELDELARTHGASLVGVGVNPGFVLDLLIVTLTAGSHTVERIEASRVNDLSPYGPTVMRTQGVGTTVEAFHAGVADGSIVGHVGFPESIRLISDALGLEVDRVEQTREPIVSTVRRETPHVVVEPGMVAGCTHTGIGYRGDLEVVRLIHPQQVQPEAEGRPTGDRIDIYGIPEIHLAIRPEIPGGIATEGMVVNMLPLIVAASPGLKRVIDLPVPAALMGPSAYARRT